MSSVISCTINGKPISILVVSTNCNYNNSIILATVPNLRITGENNIIFISNSQIGSKSSIIIGDDNKLLRTATYCIVIGKDNDTAQSYGTDTCANINDGSYLRILNLASDKMIKYNLEIVPQLYEYISNMNTKQSQPIIPDPIIPGPSKIPANGNIDQIGEQLFSMLFEGSTDILEFVKSKPELNVQDFMLVWREDFIRNLFEPLRKNMDLHKLHIHNILQKLKADYEEMQRIKEEAKKAEARNKMRNLMVSIQADKAQRTGSSYPE